MSGPLSAWLATDGTTGFTSTGRLTAGVLPSQTLWAYLELARPAMLCWAVGAIVPWLLWWRRPESSATVSWGAMQFLTQDAPLIAARDRHRQWYLLALRTAALLLIPLAMAQPTWYSGTPTIIPAGSQDSHWIFVLDGTASMQGSGVTGTRWQDAQRYLSARLDALPASAALSVVFVSDVCRVLTDSPHGNRAEVRRAMESSSASFAAVDWNQLYPKLEQLIRDQSVDFPRQHVVVISDLQATTWRHWQETDSLQALRRQLGPQLTWELGVIDGSPGPNLSLVELQVDKPMTVAGRPVQGSATVHNWDSLPQTTTITLTIDGAPVGQHHIEVPARSRETLQFEFTAIRPGLLELSAELSPDALPADNAISSPIHVDARFPVVLVNESSTEDDVLPIVLNTNQVGAYQLAYQPRRPSQLTIHDWQATPVLVVDRVSSWSSAERGAISDYVARGGAVVMFLGPETSAEVINSWHIGANTLIARRLLEPTPRGSYRLALSSSDQRSALDRIFSAHPQSGLQRTPIWQYWRLEGPRDADDPSVWLRYADGSPAAVAHAVGAGMTLALTTSPSLSPSLMNDDHSRPWSALGTWPGLIPLIHEAIFQAAGFRQQPRTEVSGVRWSDTSLGPPDDAAVVASSPPPTASIDNDATLWHPLRSHSPTSPQQAVIAVPDRPGCFVPETPGRTPQPRDVLRLVCPAEESDPLQLPIDSLPQFEISAARASQDPAAVARHSQSVGHSLAGFAVLLAAILLALESYGSRHAWT